LRVDPQPTFLISPGTEGTRKRAFELTKKIRYSPWPASHRGLRPTARKAACMHERLLERV